jgi:hypothetical protein
LVGGRERRYYGHIVIERVGKEVFLWHGFLVRVA